MVRRPIGHLRSHSAAAVLSAAIGDLRPHGISPDDLAAALLYADRVLAADDDYGVKQSLIVQGDTVGWSAVDGMVEVAAYGMLAHRQLAHQGGAGQDCPLCQQIHSMWQGSLIDPVLARRQLTATELHARARSILRDELAVLNQA
jgi:hypothetical protein